MESFKAFVNEEFDSTLEYHDRLNPVLWKGEKLRSAIRKKLIQFGHKYAEFNNVPANLIEDIILVGGNAGFNYTRFSDIDVHVIIDRNKLGNRTLVDELLQDKKKLWGYIYTIKIAGFSVEGYIQHKEDKPPKSQGVFSLLKNEWIQHPQVPPYFDTKSIGYQSKVESYISSINDLIDSNASMVAFNKMKKKLGKLRRAGLSSGGEYSAENSAWKELRNLGLFDKMNRYMINHFNKKLSLEK